MRLELVHSRTRAVAHRLRGLLATFASAALLAGCMTLGPDYARPEAPVPAAVGSAEAVSEIALPSWELYFTDPTLRELIAAALEHNRDLRIALSRVEEAR